MSQPKKKQKIQAESEVALPRDLRQKTQDLVAKLGDTLDALEESDPKLSVPLLTDASLRLLELKSLQRRVLDRIHRSQQRLVEQGQKRDEQELRLGNLKYQKVLNEHAIDTSQNPETSHLVRLCRSELHEEADEETDDQTLLRKFFNADTRDPVQRAVIVDKLNQQVRTRKKLETELKRYQQEAATLKQSLSSKRKLLQSLPSRLQEVERASLPLQKFCQKSLNASHLLGTERRTNLDLAHSLPKSLYTLYYLLQSCLDSMEKSGEMAAMEESSIAPSLEVNKDSTCVILNIPIPNISDRMGISSMSGFGSVKKMVSITFEYDDESNTVTAASSTEHEMEKVINELFADDTGDMDIGKSDQSATEAPPKSTGRPYNWCNYLAGLHLPPSERVAQPSMHKSATVVIRALVRRVRAQATLSWILHALSRKPHPFPVHPALKDASFCHNKDSSVKLVSWAEEQASSTDESLSSEDYFLATLKRKSSILSLRVGIHTARYPSIPPTWELNPEQQRGEDSLDNDTTALYDDQLSNLERRINQDVDDLVLSTDETTYDWILSHQISEIATKWEEQLVESES